MTSTDHDTEARQRFVAAVRGHLAPLGKWGRPSAALTAATVKLIAEDGELYLKTVRKAHIATMTRLDEVHQDVARLERAGEKARHEVTTLRSSLKDQAAAFDGVRIERDQLRETIADLEGQLAVARAGHNEAPEPPPAPAAPPGKPRSARARPAVSPQTAADPPAHTPVTPKPPARRIGRPGAAK